jgi:hypothetical protein
MATAQRDLWPVILPTSEIPAPLSILREQASLLESKTNGLVKAEVRSSGVKLFAKERFVEGEQVEDEDEQVERIGPQGPRVRHSFYLVAPALENYRYLLFEVTSYIEDFYPLTINFSPVGKLKVESEDEFKEALKKIFASEKTLKVIRSLIAQSQA